MLLRKNQTFQCAFLVVAKILIFSIQGSSAFIGPRLTVLNTTEKEIYVQWASVSPSSAIKKYQISAYPLQSYAPNAILNGNEWTYFNNSTTIFDLMGLHPGTLYNVTVWAVTTDGRSEPSTIQSWTEVGSPEVPQNVEIVKRNGKRMTVNLPPGESVNGPVTAYHVVILEKSPIISFASDELYNYTVAQDSGLPFYVAASLSPEEANHSFTVGDEKLYGGYFNAPLRENQEYEVLVGVLSSLNGVTKASYSPLQPSKSMSHSTGHTVRSSTLSVILSAAIGVFGFLLVLSVIIYFLLRRRYGRRRPSDELVLKVHGSEGEENGFVPGMFDINEETDLVEFYEQLKQRYWQIPRSHIEVHQTVLGIGQFGEVRDGLVHRRSQVIPSLVQQMQAPSALMEKERRNLLSELDMMSRMGFHPNVVEFLGACDEREVIQVAIEHHSSSLRGLLLRSRQQRDGRVCNLSEPLLLEMAVGVAQGMSHLADRGILHRHLSTRNIVIADGSIPKIAHFGLGHFSPLGKKLLYSKWTALEALNSHIFTSKSDVWSFGVLLWEMFTLGGSPYLSVSVKDLPTRLMQGMRLHQPKGVSDDLYQLMLHCWELDSDERPKFLELSSVLQIMFLNARDHVNLQDCPGYQYEKFDPDAEDE